MTCTPTSSPTLRAAAAPASVAAFTEATSPRTIAVTRPASTFCQPTNTTLAAFTIASVASTMPTKPRVSTSPSASPTSGLGSGLRISAVMWSDAITPERRRDAKPQRLFSEKAWKICCLDRVTREDPRRVVDAEVTDDHFGEHIPEIRRHREIAALVPLFGFQARPLAVHLAALHG